ncbi:hypothetical protein [Sagittula salina]|uniref:Uncharacterized protein n=1 Tax=Sagittula salina TaxID=2820268 RepID=A0A940MTK3_9RHOB|nr:hypothetical protein [Sagittula salina]MBP0484807.1 hypothetical protein [Sagittula salina]
MKLGFVTDSLGDFSIDALLKKRAALDRTGHRDQHRRLDHRAALQTVADSGQTAGTKRPRAARAADRGLEIIALNASGNPLHPTDPTQGRDLRDTIRGAQVVLHHARFRSWGAMVAAILLPLKMGGFDLSPGRPPATPTTNRPPRRPEDQPWQTG